MKRPTKIIIGAFAAVVAAWGAASLYFTVAGRDSSGDCLCEYLPPNLDLAPEENAYTAIKTFTDNLPTNNTTLLAIDYRLRNAYLDGETNRLDLADAAREYLAAEAPTIAAAKAILSSRGIVVEQDEVFDATRRFCTLMRIGNVYKVKATYEASSVDLATGRASLMELHDVGRFLMDSDSLAYGISALIGEALCNIALYTGAKPLFAPEDDEAWRAHLRDLARNDMAGDAERWKRMVRRSFAGYTRAEVEADAKNRMKILGVMYGKTLGDLFHLGSDVSARARMLDDPWGNTERNFLFALLMACPGYASYCFQPNRILDAHRAETDRLCRKVDQGTYDMSYAQELHAEPMVREAGVSPLARNFLGQKKMPGRNDSYAALFARRFKSRSFIAVLACQSYRAKHGKLPASLDELVPEFIDEVPRDPYDGEKLRWNAEKGYFWTKGRDGDFDGAVEFDSDGKPRMKIRNSRWIQLLNL